MAVSRLTNSRLSTKNLAILPAGSPINLYYFANSGVFVAPTGVTSIQ
jgi:hypothetical protein